MDEKVKHENEGNGCRCGYRHRVTDTDCPVTRWNATAKRIECCDAPRIERGLLCAEHEADRSRLVANGTPRTSATR